MQVATLFRETATLLGASMEAQDAPGPDPQPLKLSVFAEGPIKQDILDDGYETSVDIELRTQSENQKLLLQHSHPHAPHHHSHHPHEGLDGPLNPKCDPPEDPYSFVDDEPTPVMVAQPRPHTILLQPMPKKRGRKKKIPDETQIPTFLENTENMMAAVDPTMKMKKNKDDKFIPVFKERKKHDRFNGMPEEEVSKRTLPDHLTPNLDIVIIGINPGLFAAYKGHHYAGPGNHFWKCLYLSGLTPEPMTAEDDYKLLQVGIGFTNMVSRATKGSADLTRKEIKEGSQILLEKLKKFKPKIAVFNGKLIFEVFSGKKDFSFGRQPEFVDGTNTYMWVMPSSSARCAQLPRAADKVPFYAALKKFRDYLNGMISNLDETEVVFTDSKLKNYFEPEIKNEVKDEHNFYGYGRLPTNGELTDLSNAIVKKDDQPPAKKKRGRPKKIKADGVEPVKKPEMKKEQDNSDVPKKKRGRPKKIKTDELINANGLSDHTNSSAALSNCFSPPLQSPSNFSQNFSPSYNQSQPYSQNTSQSPSDSNHNYHHHQSPMQPQHYSQSPQPQSQPFTHSDLSSEISAAISSEHNLGSPSPTSPSLGPPDFEPPTSMPEETNDASRNPRISKEDGGDNNAECRFNSPAPTNEANMNYQNYSNFSTNSGENHSVIDYSQGSGQEYPTKRTMNQDVSSKSLSGLESLVDQIPSIAEGEGNHAVAVNTPGGEEMFDQGQHVPSSQYDNSAYMNGYGASGNYSSSSSSNPSYSSQSYSNASTNNYSVTTSNSYTSLHQSSSSGMNFSVTSLANSSTSMSQEGQVASSFSVSSLASNYSPMNSPSVNSFPNIMGGAHPMGGHMISSSNVGSPMFGGGMMDRACGIGGSMALPNPMGSMSPSSLPYPYTQYPHSASSYGSSAGGSFPYPASHGLHVPSPNYPYPSPYSNSSYPQPSYLPNHVLDRIKQDRMDIGFGSF